MSLWDHIREKQLKKMADTLRSSNASDTQFHSYTIVVRENGEILESASLRRLPSLAPFRGMIQSLDLPLRTLEVIVSPTEGVQALYIATTDFEHTRSWEVPKEAWEQVCLDLGLDASKRQRG